ncbi:hypothetical protein KUTG_00428 [Kutzneria sp. 744]|nr:hypothetical protein KUTG_00428 [Kutzneria sp. 744]
MTGVAGRALPGFAGSPAVRCSAGQARGVDAGFGVRRHGGGWQGGRRTPTTGPSKRIDLDPPSRPST